MHTLAALALSLGLAAAATAQIPSQTVDFTAAEGFTDGPANQQNGLVAQLPVLIETANGGRITAASSNYLRLVAFGGAIDLDTLAVGETVTVVARGVHLRRELPAKTEQCLGFGLTYKNQPDAANNIGTQLLFDPQGRLWLDEQSWETSPSAVDTGQRYDQPFDVVTAVTRTGARAFAADTTVNGVTARTAEVSDAESMTVGVLCQVQGTTEGTWSVGSLQVNPATLPGAFEEPE